MYFTFMEEAFIFVQLHVAVHHPFVSAKRTPFSISCRIGLVARSLSFCSSEKVFISSSFWRIVLPDTASLNRFFFPSAFLIYYPTAFWHVRFLLIKTTENLIEDHWYITSQFIFLFYFPILYIYIYIIEFVTILLLFHVFWVFWSWGMWDLSSRTRGRTTPPTLEGDQWSSRKSSVYLFEGMHFNLRSREPRPGPAPASGLQLLSRHPGYHQRTQALDLRCSVSCG